MVNPYSAGITLVVKIWRRRSQIVKIKVDLRTVRVKIRAKKDIHDDIKLKKNPLVSMVFTK